MNEYIQECESFSTEYGLKFNESKTVLQYFKPDNFKINPCTSIKMNGVLINVEFSCKYLGHMIKSKLSDNDDIKRQIRSFYGKANMLLRTFSRCSYHVKLQLFSSYCGSLYSCHLWCNYTVKQYREIQVAYNNVFRRLMGYEKFCSASGMFVANRNDHFDTLLDGLAMVFIKD